MHKAYVLVVVYTVLYIVVYKHSELSLPLILSLRHSTHESSLLPAIVGILNAKLLPSSSLGAFITSLERRRGSLLLSSHLIPRINLLLQHDAVYASLQEREHQARLSLQLQQPIENLSRWRSRQPIEKGRELRFQLTLTSQREYEVVHTFFILSAKRSYSSSTSCSSGERSSGPGAPERERDAVTSARSVAIVAQ